MLRPTDFPFVWFWKARLAERRGQRLRVLARGTLNSCLVEFEDGFRAITSRNALRRASVSDELEKPVGKKLDADPPAAYFSLEVFEKIGGRTRART
ncbi:hypothetical protein [Rubritepida flocculans]|uniref:hypothetical protein n=1 Tax=Rubritepida flocculans TaxID=182403 RepID=UPI0012EC8FFF|nr:hypothetical protein [Rubritepida flocculans]